jgi:hypothetical protein
LFADDYSRIQLKEIVDVLVADLSWRSEVLQETSHNFEFLSGPTFISMKSTELERAAYNLAVKYNKDTYEFVWRFRASSIKHKRYCLVWNQQPLLSFAS